MTLIFEKELWQRTESKKKGVLIHNHPSSARCNNNATVHLTIIILWIVWLSLYVILLYQNIYSLYIVCWYYMIILVVYRHESHIKSLKAFSTNISYKNVTSAIKIHILTWVLCFKSFPLTLFFMKNLPMNIPNAICFADVAWRKWYAWPF